MTQAHAILEEGLRLIRVPGAITALGGAHRAGDRHRLEGLALDPEVAYVLGLLHDVGRRSGPPRRMSHAPDGYAYLCALGYEDAARICLTHSFPAPLKDVRYALGEWDCSGGRGGRVQSFLDGVEYTAYDRLIQLCDALALPEGPVLMEKRLMEVTLRLGLIPGDPEWTLQKWRAFLAIKDEFDAAVGALSTTCCRTWWETRSGQGRANQNALGVAGAPGGWGAPARPARRRGEPRVVLHDGRLHGGIHGVLDAPP